MLGRASGDPGAGRARVAVGRGRGRRGGRAPPEGLGVVVNADDVRVLIVSYYRRRVGASPPSQNLAHVGLSLKNGRSHSGGLVMPSLSRVFWSSGTYPVPFAMARYES